MGGSGVPPLPRGMQDWRPRQGGVGTARRALDFGNGGKNPSHLETNVSLRGTNAGTFVPWQSQPLILVVSPYPTENYPTVFP